MCLALMMLHVFRVGCIDRMFRSVRMRLVPARMMVAMMVMPFAMLMFVAVMPLTVMNIIRCGR